MNVTYIDATAHLHELNRDALTASPIDPDRGLRISVKSEAQAMEIATGLATPINPSFDSRTERIIEFKYADKRF